VRRASYFADLLHRNRKAIVAAFAAVVVPAVWLALSLRLDGDLFKLLPDDLPAVKSVAKLDRWNVRTGHIYLGLVRPPGTDVADLKRFADAIGDELGRGRWTRDVLVGVDLGKMRTSALLYLNADDLALVGARLKKMIKAEQRKRSGLYADLDDEEDEPFSVDDILARYRRRFQWDAAATGGDGGGKRSLDKVVAKLSPDGGRFYYMSDDQRMLIFSMQASFPRTEVDHYPELVADADKAFEVARAKVPGAKAIETYFGGAYTLDWDQRTATLHDFFQSSLWAAGFILVLTALTLRRFRSTVLIFGCLLVAMALTFGVTRLAIGTVNVITVFLLAILLGLGIDFGLYFGTRYNLFAKAGLGRDASVREAWLQTAVPAAMGALTTTAVFVLLSFGRFRGFAELGVISALGVGLTWLSMYVLAPALYWLWMPATATQPGVTVESARRAVGEAASAARASRWDRLSPAGRLAPAVLACAALLTVGAAWLAREVKFAYTGEELTVKNQKSLEVDRKIVKHFGENIDPTVVLSATATEAMAVQQFFEDNFGKLPGISRYESIFTFLPPKAEQQRSLAQLGDVRWAVERLPKKSDDPNVQFLLDQVRQMTHPEPFGVDDLPKLLSTRYLGREDDGRIAGYIGFIIPKNWLWEIDELTRFVHLIEGLRVNGKPLEMTGRAQVFFRVIEVVQQETIRFSAIGLVLIFALLWAQSRRIGYALLAVLPLFVGVVWMLACLPHIGDKGIHLSFMNLVVFPILIGLGVSYGVHVTYAFRLYGDARAALRVTLGPVLGSSTTTLVGWATLIFASMIGLQGMGWVATLGMLFITLFALGVLPAILRVLQTRGWLKADLAAAS